MHIKPSRPPAECTRSNLIPDRVLKHKQRAGNRTANDSPSYDAHSLASDPSTCSASITGCHGSVRQSAIDEDGRGSVDVVDLDESLVEGGCAAIAEQTVHVRGISAIVAAALLVLLAQALDRLRLIRAGTGVVEGVRVRVWVIVRWVEPEAVED